MSYDSPLDGERLRANIPSTSRIGRILEVCPSLDSTSLEIARRCKSQTAASLNGLVLTTEEQLTGRGRRGGSWHSPFGGGLWTSAAFQTELGGEDLSLLPVVAGVSVVQAVNKLGGPDVLLKWPNDLFGRGRKLGGILLEIHPCADKGSLAVLGIGINTHLSPQDFPSPLTEKATSLQIEAEATSRETLSRNDLLPEIIRALNKNLDAAEAGETEDLGSAWKKSSLLLGRQVTIVSRNKTYSGRVIDLPLPPAIVLEISPAKLVSLKGEWSHITRIEGITGLDQES